VYSSTRHRKLQEHNSSDVFGLKLLSPTYAILRIPRIPSADATDALLET
jgi:hypothetical protein